MTDTYLLPDQVFDGVSLSGGNALQIGDGHVQAILPVAEIPAEAAIQDIAGTASPGFTDLQVNGGGDTLLNIDPTPEGLLRIAAAHHALGTVEILATVITDEIDIIARAADAVIELGPHTRIAGLHIEGPHIAPVRRGTHAADLVRPMDERTLGILRRLRKAQVTTMITVAPEAVTLDQIREMDQMGVIVSLGHTDTTAEDAQAAFSAGARCVTHLFNAMSQIQNRAPGLVGAAINSDVYAGIICDGHHVADSLVGMAIRARPVPDRMFLVSDAMPTVGGSPAFTLYGQTIRLQDGRLVNQEGSLAGAHVTMFQAVQRLVSHTGTSLETALRMATSIPRAVIAHKDAPSSCLLGRAIEDVLIIDNDLGGYQRVELPEIIPGRLAI